MPISADKKKLYPADWKQISLRIRTKRADGRCECTGQCGNDHEPTTIGRRCVRCNAPNGRTVVRHLEEPWRWLTSDDWEEEIGTGQSRPEAWADEGIRVVLTVAHLDHDPTHNDDSNLLAMCQRCHLRLDRHEHARNAAETRRRHKAHRDLFE